MLNDQMRCLKEKQDGIDIEGGSLAINKHM